MRVTDGESIASPSATRRIGADDLVRRGVLEQEAVGAGGDSAPTTWSSASKVVSTITAGACGSRQQGRGRLEPVHAPASGCPSARRRAARARPCASASAPSPASPTTDEVGLAAEHQGQRGADQRVVVDHEHPDGLRGRPSCRPRYRPAQHEQRAAPGRARACRRAARRARRGRPGRGRRRGWPWRRSRAGCGPARRCRRSGRAAELDADEGARGVLAWRWSGPPG